MPSCDSGCLTATLVPYCTVLSLGSPPKNLSRTFTYLLTSCTMGTCSTATNPHTLILRAPPAYSVSKFTLRMHSCVNPCQEPVLTRVPDRTRVRTARTLGSPDRRQCGETYPSALLTAAIASSTGAFSAAFLAKLTMLVTLPVTAACTSHRNLKVSL